MRILAFCDTHGSNAHLGSLKKKAANADIAICAGDFTVFEQGIRAKIRDIDSLGIKVYLIHGNHESQGTVRALCEQSKRITFIHKKTAQCNGWKIAGWGGGGFSLEDREFESCFMGLEKENNSRLIFVTHGPPYNTLLDKLYNEHTGNKSYLRVLKRVKPVLWVCGHIHENKYKTEQRGQTLLVNPGPKGLIVEV